VPCRRRDLDLVFSIQHERAARGGAVRSRRTTEPGGPAQEIAQSFGQQPAQATASPRRDSKSTTLIAAGIEQRCP
jgi:hypothetical protein